MAAQKSSSSTNSTNLSILDDEEFHFIQTDESITKTNTKMIVAEKEKKSKTFGKQKGKLNIKPSDVSDLYINLINDNYQIFGWKADACLL